MQILISACLLGERVRYNGTAFDLESAWLQRIWQEGRALAFCPEMAAGLPVPRPCAEIVGGNGHDVLAKKAEVRDQEGRIVTEEFLLAALKTLEYCRKNNIVLAVLTDNSPSCGSRYIYNGAFTREKVRGCGVTTALLIENGIRVFSQNELTEAAAFLRECKND